MIPKKKYYLGSLYPNVYFTSQEARCMYHALLGLNYEKTAEIMRLSSRTIGYYFNNMRSKTNASHKKFLIQTIKKTEFMQYIAELLAIEEYYLAKEPLTVH